MELINIPSERVAVLVGSNGETKRRVERMGGVRLKVGREGEVEIRGKDSYGEWRAKEVVRAIGRGFSPDKATKLFDEDYYFKVIDLKDILGSDKDVVRTKGRIIGEGGKARRIIEELSEADLCIYGNTVAIIGRLAELSLAEEAVSALIRGASHTRVWSILEKGRRRLKEERARLWEASGEHVRG
ncbi:MAG: KH domain-containing protein [Candidatus Micrarchaeia archaeon]